MENVIEFEPGLEGEGFVDKLKEMREASARVFLLYASKDDARTIFHDANYLNMTGTGYVWMVTEQALFADHVPTGTIGLRLVNASNESAHITDSLRVLALALKKLRNETNGAITEPPKDCNNTGTTWETGKTFFQYIRDQTLPQGLTGKVAFDENGDRVNAEYEIINVQEVRQQVGAQEVVTNHYVTVGQYKFNK
ncbi:unnamed protein product, partial [Meganyctiphanes norvegica]